jgi:hypothetical protein
MNDETFGSPEEEKFKQDCEIVKKAFKELIDRDHSLLGATGLVLGVIALHLKVYGFTQQEFSELLETIAETGWPDDKPKLTLVKK